MKSTLFYNKPCAELYITGLGKTQQKQLTSNPTQQKGLYNHAKMIFLSLFVSENFTI